MLEIHQVRSGAELSRFLHFSELVYRDDPHWIPPLWVHYRSLMGSLKAQDRRFLVALEDGQPVARVGVKRHGEALHFGFFECLPGSDTAVAKLFQEAHRLAPELPMRGPYHFRQEDPYTGLLVDGFHEDPYFAMPYNPPHYEETLKRAGLHPIMDLYAYEVTRENLPLDHFRRLAERAARHGVAVRSLGAWSRIPDVWAIIAIFNRALAGNWGYEPFDQSHALELLFLSLFLLDPGMCLLGLYREKRVGACVMLPNLGPLLRSVGGRCNWQFLRGLWRIRRRAPGYRAYALGVLPEAPRSVTGTLLHDAITRALERGISTVEIGWVLANNERMNSVARAIGGRVSKTYRLLERLPSPPAR